MTQYVFLLKKCVRYHSVPRHLVIFLEETPAGFYRISAIVF